MKYTFKDALVDVLHPNRRGYEINAYGKPVKKEGPRVPAREYLTWKDITGTKRHEPKELPIIFRLAINSWLYEHKDAITNKRLSLIERETKKAYYDIIDGALNSSDTLIYNDRIICMASICEVICNGIDYNEYKRITGINPKKVMLYDEGDAYDRELNSHFETILGINENYGDDRIGGRTSDVWWLIAHMVINHVDVNRLFPGGYKWLTNDMHPTSLVKEIYFAHRLGKDTKILIESEYIEVRDAYNDGVDVMPYLADIKDIIKLSRWSENRLATRHVVEAIHYALLAEVDPETIHTIIKTRGEEYLKETNKVSMKQVKEKGFKDPRDIHLWYSNQCATNIEKDLLAASAGLL